MQPPGNPGGCFASGRYRCPVNTGDHLPPIPAMTREQRTTLYMVMGVTMALDAGNGVVFGLIAEIQDRHGITTPQLGLISGASSPRRFSACSASPTSPTRATPAR